MTQGVNRGMRMPTTADLMSMWNASGLKEKLIFTFLMLVLFRLGIHMPLMIFWDFLIYFQAELWVKSQYLHLALDPTSHLQLLCS